MPATAARIGFITQEYRRAIAGPVARVIADYGSLARDNDEPVETFFDNVVDAEAMAVERLALLSPDRRRIRFDVAGCETGLDMTFDQITPTAQMIDAERDLNRPGAVVEIAIDFEKNLTTMTTWG